MRIYQVFFTNVEEEYQPKRCFVAKANSKEKKYLNTTRSLLLLENELHKYWEYGGGYEKFTLLGELEDAYFKPTLSEAEFVDEQIKSKKNGDIIGYQG